MSERADIARAARAFARDNATDCVVGVLSSFDVPYPAARHVADETVEALACWLRQRGQADAATLLVEFAPVDGGSI